LIKFCVKKFTIKYDIIIYNYIFFYILNYKFYKFFYDLFFFLIFLFLVLRFYRSPPKYSLSLLKSFYILIWIGIIFHYLIAIWIYGNPNFLLNNENAFTNKFSNSIKNILYDENLDSFWKEYIIRSTYSHNIICVVFLAIVLLVFILSNTLFRFIDCLIERKTSKEEIIKEIEEKNIEIGLGNNN
jgi:hypothetical protein